LQPKSKGTISKAQKELLKLFSKLPDSSQFYLTGGTALAEFYLGHRKSFDLDLFTAQKELVLPFSRILEEELKKNYLSKVIRRFESIVDFEVTIQNESTKIQLALDSPFRFEQTIDTEFGVKVNNFLDLCVDKLLAFFGRAEPRDAVDFYFILKQKSFNELIQLAPKKDPGFDLYWLAVSLQKISELPDNIQQWPIEMLKDFDPADLKNLFLKLEKEIMNQVTGR
jgi:predicted nucleotidyltransferase component of viral defense system